MNISLPAWPRRRNSAAGLTLHNADALPAEHAALAAAASVQATGLHLAYGSTPVLQGLDWQLLPGQVVGLLGRNGAGKTTLLETLLGLREPQAGTVRLFGQRAGQLDDATRARIGYVPQSSELFEELTPDQLLAYFRSFYPRWNSAKVESLLTRWQLPRSQLIGRLSAGQQQRLSIIRALAHEPDLLVLDEPVASLDPLARRDFLRELVEQVLDRGTTVVFSTHILSDLERVAFNVAFLNKGRIALQAPLDELLSDVLALSGPEPTLSALVAQPGVQLLARQGERWLLRGVHKQALPSGVLAQPVSLEDLFEAIA
jgi:ABC-2 type transport system ATP-binding protein